MRELVHGRVRYGYRRIHTLLQRVGSAVERNRVHHLCIEEALQLRSKLPKRRKMVVTRRDRYVPRRTNQAWSMRSLSDQPTNGQRLRALSVVDVFSRGPWRFRSESACVW
jgi:putative transposase